MEDVVEQLFEEVKRGYQIHQHLTDDILSALNFVFQAPLLPSLDLIDHGKITHLVSPSGRSVYQVTGTTGVPYCCLASSDYCSCPAYTFSVLKRGDTIMCKHVLAIHLSEAMGLCKKQEVSNKELALLLRQMD
ncbi:zinc finger SWIM domain-containing protein 7-like [Lingula anatina]|uniref:Zinc finger SWIM domain-containing protein 7-like n=1 Tax=Lingula anatina TaxID=7574 RepID=A0A1S3JNM0_LINAN|nr:zinc finger SWIM domain-containing protein 7-like [Lingula anatina]|eukprot:XP_013411947.1 zinc finger SWIM domain-containing protein 7-like [Lingula anatina]